LNPVMTPQPWSRSEGGGRRGGGGGREHPHVGGWVESWWIV
jgi:hypothetical protein